MQPLAAQSRIARKPGASGSWRLDRAARASLAALAILVLSEPAEAAPVTSYAIVQDDASLRVRGRIFRLFGIYIPPTERGCEVRIRPVRCADRAVRALELKIQGFVTCDPVSENRDGSLDAVCYVRGSSARDSAVDLGAWLIGQGLAVATPEAPFEYATLEKIARAQGRGVWGFFVDRID